MNKPRKIAFSLLIALLSGYAVFYVSLPVVEQRPFDADAWKAAAGDRRSVVRLSMVEDLKRNHILPLPGITKAEALKLLGPAEPENYTWRYDLTYRLGMERNWFPTQRYLAMAFDHDCRIARADTLPRRVWD